MNNITISINSNLQYLGFFTHTKKLLFGKYSLDTKYLSFYYFIVLYCISLSFLFFLSKNELKFFYN